MPAPAILKRLTTSLRRVVVAVVVIAVVAGGAFYLLRGADEKKVVGQFSQAVGIYPGTPVKILGVNVGSVTSVRPNGATVAVTMTYGARYQLPAGVQGVEVANSLVSDRYIQLQPAYKGGPVLASGGTIRAGNTSGPAELDDIYASLNTLSKALGPTGANRPANGGRSKGALSTLLTVAAANLKGNGAALGNSITALSKAARTLSGSRGDLFKTVANLRRFTGALSASDTQVRRFNEQLAQVSGELAGERADLGAALRDLGLALDSVSTFVRANQGKLHTSITGLEDITGVLVKEKSSLRETLALAPVALANVVHAYEPSLGALATRSNLSSLSNPVQLCGLLKAGGLLGQGLLGKLTDQIAAGCTDLLAQFPNLQLPKGLDLTGLLSGVAGGLGGLGGLGGFPIGGSS